jgi:HEAT repeat protein
MSEFLEVVRSLPPLVVFLGVGAVVFLIWYGLWRVIAFSRIKKILKDGIRHPEKTAALVREKYTARALLRRSRVVEQQARLLGREIVSLIGMDTLWIEQCLKSRSKKKLLRVLEFAPLRGLFACFQVCLKNRRLFGLFKTRMSEAAGGGAFRLRPVALACRGERFNGHAALELCREMTDELLELTADVEWNVRYFAYTILLYAQPGPGIEPAPQAENVTAARVDAMTGAREDAMTGAREDAMTAAREDAMTGAREDAMTAAREDAMTGAREDAMTGARVERALWDAVSDPRPLIRETVIERFKPAQREKYYNLLFKTVCDDPVYTVRESAWRRIHKDYPEFYRLEPQNLSADQSLHVLELLRPGNKAEENFALGFLDHSNLELRFTAAVFLEKSGILRKLFLEVDFSDMQVFERNRSLLVKAGEVNVTSFLAGIAGTNNRASLNIASVILRTTGDVDFISVLARKVFSTYDGSAEMNTVYRATVECIAERGTEEALFFLKYELEKRRMDKALMSVLLQRVPARAGFIVFDLLLSFFLQPFFEPRRELRAALKEMPPFRLLAELLKILRAGRGVYHHIVRRQAIELLGELQYHYCLETVLEHLPELPPEEAREYAAVFAGYPGELVTAKIKTLFSKEDNRLRAALITVLPSTGLSELRQLAVDSLKDMDPDVRTAGLWALVEFDDTRTINAEFEMLRDPVERVREQTALALGRVGANANLERLKGVALDGEEADAVRRAAITGLGNSASLKSIDLLLSLLDGGLPYGSQIVRALSRKKEPAQIAHMIEKFKEGSPAVREAVTEVMRRSGNTVEETMLDLLRQDSHSLRPYITGLLESTGFVENTARKLRHRDPEVRGGAASVLSLIGTPSAYRGIVYAARDPHERVRIEVVKALERLKSAEGRKILERLAADPDKKVRRYTAWAVEKLKMKDT